MKGISKEFKIGFVAIFILIFFIWGYSFLSGSKFLGPSKKTFYAFFEDVSGLKVDAPVLIAGLKVGKIKAIDLQIKKNKVTLKVTFYVQTNLKFSKNSKVFIRSINLMAGKCLVIKPVYDKEIAISGAYLESENSQDFINQISSKILPLKEKVENTVQHLDALLENFLKITNENNTKNLNAAISNLEKTTQKTHLLLEKNTKILNQTLENLHRISDTLAKANIGFMIQKITKTSQNLEKITTNIQQGKGTLGKLMHDDLLYKNLNTTLLEMQKLFKELKENPKRFVHFSIFGKKNTKSKN